MEKLTFFIFLGFMVRSIPLHSTYLPLAALLFSLKKYRDTWALFLTASSLLEVILISMPTKQFQPSNA